MKKNAEHIGLILPIGLFLIHSYLYRNWLVDDAAISIAYALNMADGHGLVSQVGRPPVEAFSNPLWVFLLAFSKALGLWHIYGTPKILALASVSLSMGLVYRLFLNEYGLGNIESLFFLSLISINAPFVCWVNAGLENGLFVLGLTVLLYGLVKKKPPFLIGLAIGVLALIRPEALLFGGVGIVFLFQNHQPKPRQKLFLLALGFMLTFGVYLAFRINYFGEYLPNPFFIKMGHDSLGTNYFLKVHHLFRSLFGPFGGFGAMGIGVVLSALWFKGKMGEKMVNPFLLWITSILGFLILPYDHLGWYRYATGFIWLGYVFLALLTCRILAFGGEWLVRRKWAVVVPGLLFLLAHIGMGGTITQKRINELPVPYDSVAQRYGIAFNKLGKELGFESGAILVPDIGGTLLHSAYEAYDFPGLIDPVIARSYQKDSATFTDYIFEEIKPVLIGAHGLWLLDKDWQRDYRFLRDYEIYSQQVDGNTVVDVIWKRIQIQP